MAYRPEWSLGSMSAEIINLKEFRRAKSKTSDEAQTRANRAKFGRDKTRKQDEARETQRREALLDGKRLDDGEEPA